MVAIGIKRKIMDSIYLVKPSGFVFSSHEPVIKGIVRVTGIILDATVFATVHVRAINPVVITS